MAFTHAGVMQLGGCPPKLPKSKQTPRAEGGIILFPSAPPIPSEPAQEPVDFNEPPSFVEDLMEFDENGEPIDDEEEIALQESTEEAPSEPADLIVSANGKIETAKTTRAHRNKKKRGRPNKPKKQFIPEGLE